MDLFDTRVAVFGAPGRYLQGEGASALVGPCAATLGYRAVVVVDAEIRAMVEALVAPSCTAAGVALTILPFAGALGATTGADLAAMTDGSRQTVIAAGGGRAVDAGKALAERLGGGLVTMPTVASNDAPTSKNFVLYDDHHRLLEVRHLMRNPDFVVVDTSVLARAPRRLFLAGLGDAIAKRFEAEACFAARGANMFMARATRLSVEIARCCFATLSAHGAAAAADAGSGRVSDDFDAAVEAMILMAGLGFESGGLSLPHALTRGISLLPDAGAAPHGLQVAWALMVHFAVLGEEAPPELLRLYDEAGLPRRLSDLGAAPPAEEALAAMVEATLAVRHMRNLPRPVDAVRLRAAILACA